ncbi:MAG: hypothetical protein ACRDUV_13495, partial [Pseudonocardiaceae bacterium]
ASTLQRTALRLDYVSPEPSSIAISHHNLANYLVRTTGTSAEQRAHRLAAALLHHLTANTHELTRTLHTLADELRRGTDAPALPSTLPEVIRLVDAGDGVRFGDLVTAPCPDPDTADRALVDLLATAATLPEQPAENTVERLLTDWDPIITAVAIAATIGHTPTELADTLHQLGAATDWAALTAALRRVLTGERDRASPHRPRRHRHRDPHRHPRPAPPRPRTAPMTSGACIDVFTDLQAVHVLDLIVDHHALPNPTRLRGRHPFRAQHASKRVLIDLLVWDQPSCCAEGAQDPATPHRPMIYRARLSPRRSGTAHASQRPDRWC